MYLSVPFILQNFFKKSQSQEDKHHFRDQNGPFVLNKKFLVQTIVITFIYLLTFFIVQNFLKKYYSESRIMTMHNFWPKMVHLPQTYFLGENLYYHCHLPISPFHCAKSKKNSSCRSRVMRMSSFDIQSFGPKIAHFPK